MPPFGKRKKKKNIKTNPPHKLNVKMSSESSVKSLDSSKSNSSVMKRQIVTTTVGDKTEYTIITTMKNESSQLNKAAKFTNKIIEEKQMQIQNILTFPGHSFILVLSEEIEEETKAYNCVLCYQNSYRTDLEGMIQHCKSKEHLLKVMELVNLKDANLSSQKATADEIAAVLKGRTSDLDKDGVSFATLSTFLSIQKKIYKRIVALRKEMAKPPASTPAKIKLSADIGANKEAGMKDPKVTTCGVNSAEKGRPQIVKFAQNPGDTSQGQKQALKRLHPSSKTLSKTAVNITVAKFESDKFSKTKERKRKIEKIVWDEDKINTSKSDSDKSSELENRKRKIEKIVWDEDKINTSKFDSDKSSEIKNGKRKIEKIVWEEDKINTSKSNLDKSSEIEYGKRKIEKIVWDEDKTTASKSESATSSATGKRKPKIIEIDQDKYKITDVTSEAGTSRKIRKRKKKQKIVEVDCEEDKVIAATFEAEKSSKTKKSKKIVLNEENFKDEDSDDGIFDLKNLNKSEREVYETYKKELNELVELNRNRRPNKIIIVTDERDVLTGDEISTNYNLFRIIKIENLTFNNIKKHLVRDPEFGSGVLYVILCGINSINREKTSPACLKAQCTSPCKFLDNTNCEIDLIRKAIFLHKAILKFNKEDTAIFSGLIPSKPHIFNNLSYKKRKCSRIHKADLPPQVH
ncbi:hypothetical protein Avbf_11794 [Armadillidium vulgare]|nr:hypothetical protein Avbf_11794 [Armadillidium vulgare]